MNIQQKVAIGAGALLTLLRIAFPVKYAGFSGFRFGGDFPEFMQKVDWQTTGMHIAGIVAVTVALALILKKK